MLLTILYVIGAILLIAGAVGISVIQNVLIPPTPPQGFPPSDLLFSLFMRLFVFLALVNFIKAYGLWHLKLWGLYIVGLSLLLSIYTGVTSGMWFSALFDFIVLAYLYDKRKLFK